MIMEDFSAGHITNDEANQIIADLDKGMGPRIFDSFQE